MNPPISIRKYRNSKRMLKYSNLAEYQKSEFPEIGGSIPGFEEPSKTTLCTNYLILLK